MTERKWVLKYYISSHNVNVTSKKAAIYSAYHLELGDRANSPWEVDRSEGDFLTYFSNWNILESRRSL